MCQSWVAMLARPPLPINTALNQLLSSASPWLEIFLFLWPKACAILGHGYRILYNYFHPSYTSCRGLKRLYVVHVGSNDIGLASSEMLKCDFKVLIKTLKDSSKWPVISGPVPLLQQVQRVTCLTTVVERLLQLFWGNLCGQLGLYLEEKDALRRWWHPS